MSARPGSETQAALSEPGALLRRLTASDEQCLEAVLSPCPRHAGDHLGTALDRRTTALIRLAALLAVGAPTESLRWAVDLASTTGAPDDMLIDVLLTVAPAAGAAQLVAAAPRLGLALDLDVEATDGEPADGDLR
jgi:alkylhydroperoxidase/carboxymuconolactone decarboxylase family protein YurZ